MEKSIRQAKVSFVIRTYNEAAFIGRCLDVIGLQQGIAGKPDVIVVDSGSSDATVSIAEGKGARLLHIRKEDFDYSKALNLGIRNCPGEFIAVLSAHSIPCDSAWLALLLSHFRNPEVAGVYSRQVSWPDTHWWEVRRIQKEFGEKSLVYDRTTRHEGVSFSNAASCIRRTVWEQRPFTLPTGEDGEWATWAVSQGFKIVYEARTAVFHSHQETCRQAMRRVIEFEKAVDRTLGRSRTLILTLRQATGRMLRDLRDVRALKNAPRYRHRLVWESLVRSYWFLRDFSRETQFRSPMR